MLQVTSLRAAPELSPHGLARLFQTVCYGTRQIVLHHFLTEPVSAGANNGSAGRFSLPLDGLLTIFQETASAKTGAGGARRPSRAADCLSDAQMSIPSPPKSHE